MTKLPLNNIANLQNESTVVTTIATNNAATTAAMEKTLSRDGTSPNQMNADLDMNSHRVLNLVDAIDNKEPATFNQLKNSITAVGSGAVVNGTYLTLSNNVNLLSNRVLTPGINIGFTDTGATGTLTVAVNDPELNAIAGLTSAADTVPYFTGSGTASVTSLPAYGRNLISSPDATTARATLNSVIGTDVEAHDPTLTALAAFNTNGLITQTAADTFTSRTLTGTGNEVTITNGSGVSGNPTVSLPAALTFTGKTVTGGSFSSPSITTPTGIVKADVGLGNVDNTSDATKNAAVATLTNKTLTTPVIASITNTGTLTLPTGPETLVARATTDTLTNKSISGSTNTLSAVPLTALATQAAYTFVGNNTGSAAAPTAVDIAALTTKASPAASDYAILSDQAAAGAWKKATVSSLASAGSVASIAGNTGAFTLGNGITNNVNVIQSDVANQLYGNAYRNRLVNGNFVIDQRKGGSAYTLASGNNYTLDWWFAGSANTAVTLTQNLAGGPTTPQNIISFVRLQRPSTNANVSAISLGQIVPYKKFNDLAGFPVTLSFYARCGANYSAASSALAVVMKTGTTVDQGNAGFTGGTWAGIATPINTTATLTTSWQRFQYTATVAAAAAELGILFQMTPVGTAGAADYFDITGVQLEGGSVATTVAMRPYPVETGLSNERLILWGATFGSGYDIFPTWWSRNGTVMDNLTPLPVALASIPTIISSSPTFVSTTPGSNQIAMFDQTNSGFVTLTGALTITTSGNLLAGMRAFPARLQAATSWSGVNGDNCLMYLGTAAYIGLSCEL